MSKIFQKRNHWCVRLDNGQLLKFPTEKAAKSYLNEDDLVEEILEEVAPKQEEFKWKKPWEK